MKLVKNQPVLVASLVAVVVALASAFGLDLTAGQVAGVQSVVTSILGALVWRSVKPVAKP